MRLDGTSFALDAPSGGDFIETNVALDTVLQAACEIHLPKEGGGSRGNFSFHGKDRGAQQE